MKRFISITIVLTFVFLSLAAFSSCSGQKDDSASPKAMFDEAVSLLSLPTDAEVFYSATSDELYYLDDDLLNGKFGELMDYPKISSIDAYAVYYSNTLYDTEFGIFRMKSEDEAKQMKLYIDARITRLLKNAVNYPSVDTDLIKNYTVKVDGIWVYYAATKNNSGFNNLVKNKLYNEDKKA
jgi:hypothetical protein